LPDQKTEQQIEKLLQKKEDDAIDRMVYDLYHLSADEIEFVENQ